MEVRLHELCKLGVYGVGGCLKVKVEEIDINVERM
jgi:hypothetical protein